MVITRRAALLSLAVAPAVRSQSARPPLCIFSKHMAKFGYEDLAKHAKEIGFDGVDLTVRAEGHVLPANVARDLPKAVAILRERGLIVPMITTGLLRADEAPTRPTLATAARLKIPYWKSGYHRYTKLDAAGRVEQLAAEYRPQVAGLAALSKEYGITCGLHNHSGDYYGSAVWDLREAMSNLDPKYIGYYFDPAHATVEGGLGNWRTSLNLVAPRLKMVSLKDFYWEKTGGKWNVRWCPIGQGMVDWPVVFKSFKAASFTGPLTLHTEYEMKDELASIAKDYEFVRSQMKAVWG
ncbi:MAG: TIM barrel protein [Bryobacteraceae bacterium]|nr:TIM barrel protein [Bryobacteraceae bacterium]